MEESDIHSTGITCMFIASKYEEIFPIKLRTVFNKIGHQKISMDSLKQKEALICTTLNY